MAGLSENWIIIWVSWFIYNEIYLQIYDKVDIGCPIWARRVCYSRYSIIMSVIAAVGVFYLFVIIGFIVYRNHLMSPITRVIKNHYNAYMTYWRFRKYLGLTIVYDQQDAEFVFEEFLPAIKAYSEYNQSLVCQDLVTVTTNKDKLRNKMNPKNKDKVYMVVFSPNYLRAQFKDVSIKNILSVMKEARNTMYIFTDIGPDDSIYAFLKEQRDPTNSVVWNQPYQWDNFSKIADVKDIGNLVADYKKLNYKLTDRKTDTEKTQVMLPGMDRWFISYFANRTNSGHFFRNHSSRNEIYYHHLDW